MMNMVKEFNAQFFTLLSTESLKDKDTIQLVKREEPVIIAINLLLLMSRVLASTQSHWNNLPWITVPKVVHPPAPSMSNFEIPTISSYVEICLQAGVGLGLAMLGRCWKLGYVSGLYPLLSTDRSRNKRF